MILLRYENCPICHAHDWHEYRYGTYWFEQSCGCLKFNQFFQNSFQDPELKYLVFAIPDYHIYVYSETCPSVTVSNKMFVYHAEFPRGINIQGPFQVWEDYMPDFQQLDKLNARLNLLRTFA